jgi:hypothetical protein
MPDWQVCTVDAANTIKFIESTESLRINKWDHFVLSMTTDKRYILDDHCPVIIEDKINCIEYDFTLLPNGEISASCYKIVKKPHIRGLLGRKDRELLWATNPKNEGTYELNVFGFKQI